jgi:hypothetical protein
MRGAHNLLLVNLDEPKISPCIRPLCTQRVWKIPCRSDGLRGLKWVCQQYAVVFETKPR